MRSIRPDRTQRDGQRVTAAELIAPWPRADRVDRAIQDIARRWLARSLLVTLAGCSASHAGSGAKQLDTMALTGDAAPATDGAVAPNAPSVDAAVPVPVTDAGPIDAGEPDPLAPLAPGLLAADSDFDPIDCGDRGWDPMPFVKPSQAFDYAALRVYREYYADSAPMTTSEVGTPCATATDANACSEALAKLPATLPKNECSQGGCDSYFVSTSLGDAVRLWSSRNELLAFLGPIDSPEDALLLVYYDGYHIGHSLSGGCETAAVRAVDGGFEVYATRMTSSCPVRVARFLLNVSSDGVVSVVRSAPASEDNVCIGRRPEGLVADDVIECGEIGAFFARHAQLEAASVHAFDHMIAELIAHGAPSELVAQARAAREDEIVHAKIVGDLARRYGARVPAIHVQAPAPRSLLAMAIENAVEGCVRETWGALLGTYQAHRARDPEIAATFLQIADDERRHATLSWRVAAWLDIHLTRAQRAQVASAYAGAIVALREEQTWSKSAAVAQAAGLPDPATALALLADLDAIVWAAA